MKFPTTDTRFAFGAHNAKCVRTELVVALVVFPLSKPVEVIIVYERNIAEGRLSEWRHSTASLADEGI